MDEGWLGVAQIDDLPEGKGVKVMLSGVAVLVVRSGDQVFAISNRCSHQSAPLHRGPINLTGSPATVTCPVHGSVFGLEEGRVIRGPATTKIEAFDTRVVDGSVEIRSRE